MNVPVALSGWQLCICGVRCGPLQRPQQARIMFTQIPSAFHITVTSTYSIHIKPESQDCVYSGKGKQMWSEIGQSQEWLPCVKHRLSILAQFAVCCYSMGQLPSKNIWIFFVNRFCSSDFFPVWIHSLCSPAEREVSDHHRLYFFIIFHIQCWLSTQHLASKCENCKETRQCYI